MRFWCAGFHRGGRVGFTILLTAVLLVLTMSAAPAGASPDAPVPSAVASPQVSAESAPAADQIRYYLVGPGSVGRPEYLYRIAFQTLGDGNRYREIFDLNQERVQPDGGRLTDPARLRPGWVLILPADAAGDQVRIGPPPAVDVDRRLLDTGTLIVVLVAIALIMATVLRRPARTPFAVRRIPIRWRRTRLSQEPVRPSGDRFPGPPVVPPAEEPAEEPDPATVGSLKIVLDGLRADVTTDVGRLRVELSGAVPETAVAWLTVGEPVPTMMLPVEIGRSGGLSLHLDLAVAPGVFTLAGPAEEASRHARTIAARLHSDGHAVLVVGEVLGAILPPGWVRLAAVPTSVEDLPGRAGVLFCGGLRGSQLAAAHRMVAWTGGRVVPVVVGTALRGRWSAAVLDTSEAGEG